MKKLMRAERIAQKHGNALVRQAPSTMRVTNGTGKHKFSRLSVKGSPVVTRQMTLEEREKYLQ